MSLFYPSLRDATFVCFSHLRWDFVYQRPQHLLSRMAKSQPVLYVEEPVPTEGVPRLDIRNVAPNVRVVVPHLPAEQCAPGHAAGEARQRALLNKLLGSQGIVRPVLWYYTPMSLGFSDQVPARLVVYDCMDELSNFDHAPAELVPRERALLGRADVVFTGGHSLYQVKRRAHAHVHAFPSSVDVRHFAQARHVEGDPADMAGIPHPRIGFYGVIDERLDVELLDAVARARPDWHWILLGPVVKIDPARLPRHANVHLLGSKRYDQLPAYLGRWDVAMMPFALNDSTRFISPTKTPEYLAGGCPVVSTPITDVVNDYGRSGLVRIARGADEFVASVQATLNEGAARRPDLCQRADARLRGISWDLTCSDMMALMAERLAARAMPVPVVSRPVVRHAGAVGNSTASTEAAV